MMLLQLEARLQFEMKNRYIFFHFERHYNRVDSQAGLFVKHFGIDFDSLIFGLSLVLAL